MVADVAYRHFASLHSRAKKNTTDPNTTDKRNEMKHSNLFFLQASVIKDINDRTVYTHASFQSCFTQVDRFQSSIPVRPVELRDHPPLTSPKCTPPFPTQLFSLRSTPPISPLFCALAPPYTSPPPQLTQFPLPFASPTPSPTDRKK